MEKIKNPSSKINNNNKQAISTATSSSSVQNFNNQNHHHLHHNSNKSCSYYSSGYSSQSISDYNTNNNKKIERCCSSTLSSSTSSSISSSTKLNPLLNINRVSFNSNNRTSTPTSTIINNTNNNNNTNSNNNNNINSSYRHLQQQQQTQAKLNLISYISTISTNNNNNNNNNAVPHSSSSVSSSSNFIYPHNDLNIATQQHHHHHQHQQQQLHKIQSNIDFKSSTKQSNQSSFISMFFYFVSFISNIFSCFKTSSSSRSKNEASTSSPTSKPVVSIIESHQYQQKQYIPSNISLSSVGSAQSNTAKSLYSSSSSVYPKILLKKKVNSFEQCSNKLQPSLSTCSAGSSKQHIFMCASSDSYKINAQPSISTNEYLSSTPININSLSRNKSCSINSEISAKSSISSCINKDFTKNICYVDEDIDDDYDELKNNDYVNVEKETYDNVPDLPVSVSSSSSSSSSASTSSSSKPLSSSSPYISSTDRLVCNKFYENINENEFLKMNPYYLVKPNVIKNSVVNSLTDEDYEDELNQNEELIEICNDILFSSPSSTSSASSSSSSISSSSISASLNSRPSVFTAKYQQTPIAPNRKVVNIYSSSPNPNLTNQNQTYYLSLMNLNAKPIQNVPPTNEPVLFRKVKIKYPANTCALEMIPTHRKNFKFSSPGFMNSNGSAFMIHRPIHHPVVLDDYLCDKEVESYFDNQIYFDCYPNQYNKVQNQISKIDAIKHQRNMPEISGCKSTSSSCYSCTTTTTTTTTSFKNNNNNHYHLPYNQNVKESNFYMKKIHNNSQSVHHTESYC